MLPSENAALGATPWGAKGREFPNRMGELPQGRDKGR